MKKTILSAIAIVMFTGLQTICAQDVKGNVHTMSREQVETIASETESAYKNLKKQMSDAKSQMNNQKKAYKKAQKAYKELSKQMKEAKKQMKDAQKALRLRKKLDTLSN